MPGFTALPNPPTHISTLTGLGFAISIGVCSSPPKDHQLTVCAAQLKNVVLWRGRRTTKEDGRLRMLWLVGVFWWGCWCAGGAVVGCSGVGALAGFHRERRERTPFGAVLEGARVVWWWCSGGVPWCRLVLCSGGGGALVGVWGGGVPYASGGGARPAQNGGDPDLGPRPS